MRRVGLIGVSVRRKCPSSGGEILYLVCLGVRGIGLAPWHVGGLKAGLGTYFT